MELPQTPRGDKKSAEEDKRKYDIEMASIVKDVVSFYNSYGGYIVVGVRDKPREVVGFSQQIDCGELVRRVEAVTRHRFDCHFALVDCVTASGATRFGLLFIPQRPEDAPPAQFLKDAPAPDRGVPEYRRESFYLRQGDECKPARTPEDHMFLCCQGRRRILSHTRHVASNVTHNLGSPDPGFVGFVGRGEYLQELWSWLSDRFNPVRAVYGLGGVGKTTLARVLAEDITRNPPNGVELVIWLSAKKRFYHAARGEFIQRSSPDFYDTNTLLRALLAHLGETEDLLRGDWSDKDLVAKVVDALKIFPSFIVIDDLDTLDLAEQREAFHTVLQIMERALSSARVPSRALLTTRLDLGFTRSMMTHVRGLPPSEFLAYVAMTANSLGLPWNLSEASAQMADFRRMTDGSPTFAASILRLVKGGLSLEKAIHDWRGRSGEEVRDFAFGRELDRLGPSGSPELKTLYAACVLGRTSSIELLNVTEIGGTLLEKCIAQLKEYHLIAEESELPKGGLRISVPSAIVLMTDLIRQRVRDPQRIENACRRARRRVPRLELGAGEALHRILALLNSKKPDEALEVAKSAIKKYPENGDLHCLLGETHLRLLPPEPREADMALEKAYNLRCNRPELMNRWIEARRAREDWHGVVEVSRLADRRNSTADNVLERAEAFGQLGDLGLKAGQFTRAAGHYLSGAKEIRAAFLGGTATERTADLDRTRAGLLRSYVDIKDREFPDPEQHIYVWQAVVDAYRCHPPVPHLLDLVRLGVARLVSWWAAVEKRTRFQEDAANKLERELNQNLAKMLAYLMKHKALDPHAIDLLQENLDGLVGRLADYRVIGMEGDMAG